MLDWPDYGGFSVSDFIVVMMNFLSLRRGLRGFIAVFCATLCAVAGLRAQTAGNLDMGYDPNVSVTNTAQFGPANLAWQHVPDVGHH